MLLSNASEVTEPYVYEYVNSLTDKKESVTRWEGINLNNTLSLHLKAYVKEQLKAPLIEDEDIVAEDE